MHRCKSCVDGDPLRLETWDDRIEVDERSFERIRRPVRTHLYQDKIMYLYLYRPTGVEKEVSIIRVV